MNKDKVQCQICKDYFKQITATHLRVEHDITFKEYKEMFPNAETHPRVLRDKLVAANVEKWSDPDYKESTAKSISDKNKIIMNEPEMTEKLKEGSARRWSHKEERERQGQILLKQWEDEDFKKMQREKALKQWEDEDFRNAVIEAGKKQTGENNHFYKHEIDIWIEENTNQHLCKCGCGRYIIIERDQYHIGIPKYYCKECYNNDMSGENNPMFGKLQTEESRILISCAKQGINIEDFSGFITPYRTAFMASPEYIQWRTSVFERDDYTCQKCGERGGDKNVHHILPFRDYPDHEYSLNINNGITLCPKCHRETFGKEYDFVPEYLGIIFDNKGIDIFGGEILVNKQNKLSDYY